MKHKLLILAAALSSLFLVSCKEDEPVAKEPTLSVVKNELSIPGKGGEAVVEVQAEGAFEATVDKDWLNCSKEGSKIVLSAGENPSIESRYASLLIKNNEESIKLSVVQLGQKTSGFDPDDIKVSSDGGEFTFEYSYDTKMTATADAEWVSLDITEDCLTVTIAENTVQGTPENPARFAEIKWTLGADNGVIGIRQSNVSFMKVDPNWNVEYLGVQDYEGEDVEEIQNNVTDPTISGKYAVSFLSKAEVTASGMEIQDYISDVFAPAYIAEVEEIIAYYAQYGITLAFEDLLFEDTDFQIFDIFTPGDYYGIAVGFTEDADLTGHYAYCEFTKEGGSDPGPGDGGYSSWLGEWTDAAGSTWTISEKVKDQTFTITGIEGQATLPLTAEYDPATKALSVRCQMEIGTYESSSHGTFTMGYYGLSAEGSFFTPNDPANSYTIFIARLAADGASANLTGESITSDQGEVKLAKGMYIGTGDDGKYYSITSKQVTMPSTITKKGGNGGGDNPGGGNADYNKFLGKWTVTPANSAAQAWTAQIKQKTADKDFEIYDWQGWSDDWMAPVSAEFNGGKIIFKGGTTVAAAKNVQIDDTGDLYNIYYMSSCIIDGDSYVILSGSELYNACQGTIDGSGNIILTGLDIKLSDGNTYTFVDFGIVAMDAETDGDKAIYTFQNEAGEFPVTMKKAGSGSSVRTMGLSMKNAVKVDPSHVIRAASSDEVTRLYNSAKAYTAPKSFKKHIAR